MNNKKYKSKRGMRKKFLPGFKVKAMFPRKSTLFLHVP